MDVYFCSENILFSEIPLSIETATRAFLQARLKIVTSRRTDGD